MDIGLSRDSKLLIIVNEWCVCVCVRECVSDGLVTWVSSCPPPADSWDRHQHLPLTLEISSTSQRTVERMQQTKKYPLKPHDSSFDMFHPPTVGYSAASVWFGFIMSTRNGGLCVSSSSASVQEHAGVLVCSYFSLHSYHTELANHWAN